MIIPYYMEIMGVDRPDRTNDAQLMWFDRIHGPPPKLPPPEIAGLMIRAYENPLVSLKAGYEKPLFLKGGSFGGG